MILWGAVAVVLLIGCVNIAGLLMARGVARAPELATRIALGGGRGAIVRQLLAESAVLAVGGGPSGVAIGSGGLPGVRASFSTASGGPGDPGPDPRVLAVKRATELR